MATPRKWSNVAVAMESARAAAITISAISKAAEAQVTYTGTQPAAGSFVLIRANGMTEVGDRVFRVKSPTASTFLLEGENSTAYGNFTSGTFQLITFGTSITTATSVSASGGNFGFIGTTTIHDNRASQIPGLPEPLSYSFDNIWDVSDAGLLALKQAYDAQTDRCFRFTFGTGGQIMAFNGFCGASLAPQGQAQDLVTTPSVITVFGSPTYYAS